MQSLYRIFTSAENRVAGGEGIVGVYGSLTGSSMSRIFSSMKMHSGFDEDSIFFDIGAGLGRPLLHALYLDGVRDVRGIEMDHVKCIKAHAFGERVARTLHERNVVSGPVVIPEITCGCVESLSTIEPATHAFTFWEGIPNEVRDVIVELCVNSRTVKAITVVQRAQDPGDIMTDDFELVDSFKVTMSGSSSKFVAYIFKKLNVV